MYKISKQVNNNRSERFVYDFFGIISNKKDFNIIKLEIEKSIKDASIILIDKENIENLQNIKFEALIINSEINLDNKSIVFLQKSVKI